MVNLLGIPEFPSRIEVYPVTYVSHIERAERKNGNLVISEIKTSKAELMPDHLLQVWGYCLSAPGGLVKAFGRSYRAKRIQWQLTYHDKGSQKPRKIIGPFAFDGYAFEILCDAMSCFSRLYSGLKTNDLPGPSTGKCVRCGYSWICKWKSDISSSEYITSNEMNPLYQSPLLKLQQVGFRRIKSMTDIGIKTIDDVCEKNRDILRKLPGSSDWHVNKWIQQAEAIKAKKVLIIDSPFKQKLHNKDMICYDIETNEECNHVWIIGAFDFNTEQFHSFFAKKDEKRILMEFESFLKSRDSALLVSYSNCYFEKRILTECSSKYKLDYLLKRVHQEIDLGIEIQNILIGDFNQYKLKDLATRFGFQFRHPEIDGFIVGMEYSNYLSTGEELDWKSFIEYNEDDVMALSHMIKYIQRSKIEGDNNPIEENAKEKS